jgi:glycine oxidase
MTNILIIGGGIIGLSAAYRFAKAGAAVTVVERQTFGSGATLASLGALWPARPSITGPLQNFQRQSLWMLEEFVREIEAESGVAIPFVRHGHLEILTTEKATADAQRDAAIAAGWPTFGHSRAIDFLAAGAALPADIRTDDRGVLHSHVTAQVDVAAYVAALVAACRKLGVDLREHSPVTKLVEGDGVVHSVETSAASIDTREARVLVTAGAWTAQIHPLLAGSAATRPVKGQAVEVEPLGAVPDMIIKRDKTYMVPWLNASRPPRVLIGSTTEKTAGFDTSPPPETAAALLESAAAFCPALKNARIIRTWAGLRPDAPKHRPIMGKIPGVANLFVSAGHYKTGIGLSALASQAMAALMLGNPLPADLTPFGPK